MRLLGREEIVEQSKRAYNRWKDIWHANAKQNAINYKDIGKLWQKEKGRKCLIFAYGPSLIENLQAVKDSKMHYDYDIICIDKSLKTCLEYGIIPKYCVLSDAQVDFEEYGTIEPNLIRNIKLFMAITGNSKWSNYWSKNGGDVHFYLNKDNIRTHTEFSRYLDFNKAYLIPASSNVGNTAYVFAVLVLGYREILLGAYDYSYSLTGKYYGNQKKEPVDTNLKYKKHSLYNHYTAYGLDGELIQISHNMQFSAKWLIDFINVMSKQQGCRTINVTGHGILRIPLQGTIRIKKEVAV